MDYVGTGSVGYQVIIPVVGSVVHGRKYVTYTSVRAGATSPLDGVTAVTIGYGAGVTPSYVTTVTS